MQSSSRGVKRTLKGHTGQVTTVKSLEEGSGPYQLVSGDSVGEVRLWTTDNDQVGLTIRAWTQANGAVLEHIDKGSQGLDFRLGSFDRIRTSSWPYPHRRLGRTDQALGPLFRQAGYEADDRLEGEITARSSSR
jgi:WD40 repeat protein